EDGEVLRFLRAPLVVETLACQADQLDEQVAGRHGPGGPLAASLCGGRQARRRTGAADVLEKPLAFLEGHVAHQPPGRAARRTVKERRSEEHTSELQSRGHLVCRLLLEKKNPTSHHYRVHN